MRVILKGQVNSTSTAATDPTGHHVIGQMAGVDVIAGTWSEGSCYYQRGTVKIPRKAGVLPSLEEAIRLFAERDALKVARLTRRNHGWKRMLRDFGDGLEIWHGVFRGRNTYFISNGYITIDLPKGMRVPDMTAAQAEAELSKKIIHDHNDGETRIIVANGYRGPYVTDGVIKVSVPSDQDPLMMTERRAKALLAAAYADRTGSVNDE